MAAFLQPQPRLEPCPLRLRPPPDSLTKIAGNELREKTPFFDERFGVFPPFMFGNSGIPVWMLAVIGRHGTRKGGIFFSLDAGFFFPSRGIYFP